jgi:hypothetical protein
LGIVRRPLDRGVRVKAYVALDETDLRALVRGESVAKLASNGAEVEIILFSTTGAHSTAC